MKFVYFNLYLVFFSSMLVANDITVLAPPSLINVIKNYKDIFEKKFCCKVKLLPSSVGLISYKQADIIMGYPYEHFIHQYRKNFKIFSKSWFNNLTLPFPWQDNLLIPICYHIFGFVYNKKIVNEISSMDDLINSSHKIILMDPRTSSMGYGLLCWMRHIYRNDVFKKCKKLHSHVLTYAKHFSQAYTLFVSGEAPIVLATMISPAYNRMKQQSTCYPIEFSNGHYCQYQIMGIFNKTNNTKLSYNWCKWVLSDFIQQILFTHYFAHPVIDLPGKKGQTVINNIKILDITDFPIKKSFIQQWLSSFIK